MEPDKVKAVNQCIQEAARQTASVDGLMVPIIDRFLRAGEETWEGAGSGRFTHGQIKQDEAYTRAAKTALQTLFRLLSNLLPAGAQLVPQVAPEILRRRVEPMVTGLVQCECQKVALRELTARTFVLNFQGAKVAIDAELSTCYIGAAWQFSGLSLRITGSNQTKSRRSAMAYPQAILRTCGVPPTRRMIPIVT